MCLGYCQAPLSSGYWRARFSFCCQCLSVAWLRQLSAEQVSTQCEPSVGCWGLGAWGSHLSCEGPNWARVLVSRGFRLWTLLVTAKALCPALQPTGFHRMPCLLYVRHSGRSVVLPGWPEPWILPDSLWNGSLQGQGRW